MATNIERTRPLAARLPSVTKLLAIAALPLLGYEAWTIAGWLADGPSQITAYRDRGSTSWYAARVVEIAVVASVAWWVLHIVRERRRTGRLGTDGLLIAGMFSAAFWDPIYNWLNPAWLYSSNFLNVNDWFGFAPFVPNEDAGRLPWPVIVVVAGYPLWCVGFAAIVNAVMKATRGRRPATGDGVLAGLAFVLAGAITAVAFATFRALDLMAAPGYRLEVLGGEELLVFFWSGGLVFGGLACLRFFRDARGRTLVERGPSGRTNLLAAIAACQILVIVGWGLLTVPLSTDPAPPEPLPAHLTNGVQP